MKLEALVRRRFEVLLGVCFLGLSFVGLVWLLMAILKAIDPVSFHFNLLMDILPWFTPVLLLLVLLGPLYWKVAGLLGPGGGVQRLATARYQLIVGAFFYLLCYTLGIWLAMNLLRVWDVQDFHFNLLVDWLPAIVPPWLGWVLGAPLVWRTLAALDPQVSQSQRSMTRWAGAATAGVVGACLLVGGGLLLNLGVYAVSQSGSPTVASDLTTFGVLLFAAGAITWAVMLYQLGWCWRRGEPVPAAASAADRFRSQRGRILAQGFVLANLVLGAMGLLMAGLQAIDPPDFHFYLALDIWSVGLPLFFAWLIFALAAAAIPAWLASRDPAHHGPGVGTSSGPSGPVRSGRGWGYSEGDLISSGG
ncbi:MAG: hypothetical protein ACREOD_04560 [Candidatus Dormibacteria bacterium]